MNPEPELERLISRLLDEEATASERRELRSRERSDPNIAALVDEYVTLDREVGRALRKAMGRSVVLPMRGSAWGRLGQVAAFAAAACLAVAVWLNPPGATTPRSNKEPTRAMTSWFAPTADRPAELPDAAEEVQLSHELPQVRLRDTDSDWIIIPGRRPGEFMVIEVNRVRTRAITIQGDF